MCPCMQRGKRWSVYKRIKAIIHVSIKTVIMRRGDAGDAENDRNPIDRRVKRRY